MGHAGLLRCTGVTPRVITVVSNILNKKKPTGGLARQAYEVCMRLKLRGDALGYGTIRGERILVYRFHRSISIKSGKIT